jgi:ABC-type branched-subunit amino acid transport system ATPase component
MLSIRNIVKQYAGHRALSDVSLEVEKGQIFGLLGPNGAGKTSLKLQHPIAARCILMAKSSINRT